MPGDDSSARTWRAAAVLLVLVALALVATLVVLLGRHTSAGAAATSEDSRAAALRTSYAGATRAAREETEAFLGVDYRAPGPVVARVLAGATGHFKQQYAAGRARLERSAQRSRAVSTGTARAVGVSALSATRATVLVAADARVTNRSTTGAEPRYYRLRLTLVKQGGTWLTSGLEFVG